MNKRKSITLLVISIVLILLLGVMTFCPVVVPLGNVDYHSPVTLIEYGLDLKGGSFVTFEVNKNELSDSEYAEGFDEVIATLEDRMSLIESRMGIQGFTEALVASSPAEGLVSVEVPATESALSISDVFGILGSKGELVISLNEDGSEPFIPKNAQGDELTWNECIVRADAIYDSSTSSYGIYVEFDDFGLEALKEGTSAITSSTPIYFILDGETISNPNVSSQITSNYSQITGLSTPVAAQTMAIQFMSGSYPLDVVNTMDFNDVGAELGNDTANMLLLVYAVMSVIIIVAFIAVYRLMGVAFTLSFLFYLILLAFAIAFIPLAQFMSLAGFVGLFFGLAMFAALNAVLLGNINSEFKKGKSFELSFDDGFKKSVWTILNGAIVVLLGLILIWIIGTGSIEIFAMGATFSLVLGLIATFLFTRGYVKVLRGVSPDNDKAFGIVKEDK
jgi:protein-export membrane protein SecD